MVVQLRPSSISTRTSTSVMVQLQSGELDAFARKSVGTGIDRAALNHRVASSSVTLGSRTFFVSSGNWKPQPAVACPRARGVAHTARVELPGLYLFYLKVKAGRASCAEATETASSRQAASQTMRWLLFTAAPRRRLRPVLIGERRSHPPAAGESISNKAPITNGATRA